MFSLYDEQNKIECSDENMPFAKIIIGVLLGFLMDDKLNSQLCPLQNLLVVLIIV